MANKLFMVLLGATVPGRLIEQHDIFFAAATDLPQLVPALQNAWPNASIHVDSFRTVTAVGGHRIHLSDEAPLSNHGLQLFFFNLGGYVQGDMEERHHKALIVAASPKDAISQIKQTAFYQNCGYQGAESHIDDQLNVDIDDVHVVGDLLASSHLYLHIEAEICDVPDDAWQVGYLSLKKLAKQTTNTTA